MKTLLIVWHSRTGAAQQMAKAAADGAHREPAAYVRLLAAHEASADHLMADAGQHGGGGQADIAQADNTNPAHADANSSMAWAMRAAVWPSP